MDNREVKRVLQELQYHQGWELYKGLLSQLREKILVDLASAGRAGDGVRAARFTGQLDLLDLIPKLPEQELKKRA